MRCRSVPAAVLVLAALSAPAAGQEAGIDPARQGWNAPRALELIERARERRSRPRPDTALENYSADARGYVYFYLDRRDSDERTLVKVDQVALEVYWQRPNRTKQRIVGLRDESRLPNRMRYHLDHLTVVQNEFADVIRLGDGDEVRDVLHPAAPGSDSLYDFRLADSLTLRLPGTPEPVRVYELQVRPRHFDRSGYVGSVFLDRATADIVRMSFTFTPASYVDPRLDYIHVSLDNGLWDGRWWLPHEQRVEIRRQLPELDFPAGGVIRGVMRLSGYRFNRELPDGLFRGPPVVALPPGMRESFPFEQGLFEELNQEGLAQPEELAGLRDRALELAKDRYLSGLPRLRLHLPNSSAALRYDRAEGLLLGAGLAYAVDPKARLEAGGGYAFGPGRPALHAALRADVGASDRLRVEAFHRRTRDVGPTPGAAGALNTLAAVTLGHDYLDPYFATGGEASLETRLGDRWRVQVSARVEEHAPATLAVGAAPFDDEALFRPVRRVHDGLLLGTRSVLSRAPSRAAGFDWDAELAVEAGAFRADAMAVEDGPFLRPVLRLAASHRPEGRGIRVRGGAAAGMLAGGAPAQALFLLGGRATLPGYAYRSFGGDRFLTVDLEASRPLLAPWVSVRALAAAGWSDYRAAFPPDGWDAPATGRVRTAVGAGLGLVHDILRLDIVRGLNGGETQWLLSVDPRLWDIL